MVVALRLSGPVRLALIAVCAMAGAVSARAQEVPAPVAQDIPVQPLTDAVVDRSAEIAVPTGAASLHDLVAAVPVPTALPADIECMADAIYFEARSESLAGQLAVGRVIVARAGSGRYPGSYCGVVYQPSQFSFIHHGAMPVINRTSAQWLNAVRIALIAHGGVWKSPAEGALFFHAARIRAASGRTRVARIDNHVFYR